MTNELIFFGAAGIVLSLGIGWWLIRRRQAAAQKPTGSAQAARPARPIFTPFQAQVSAFLFYAVGLGLLASQIADYTQYRFPMHTGTVIAQELRTPPLDEVDRPYLTIQVDGTQEIVHAFLVRNGPQHPIPQHVHFPYSGDPQQEVWLLEENNDIRGGLTLLVLGAIANLAGYLVSRRKFPFGG